MGIRYYKPFPNSSQAAEVPSSWHRLLHQMGGSRSLSHYHGKQFDNSAFKDFYSKLGIKNHYSSLAHPQANGQVEVTNRSLLKIIKIQLEGAKGMWSDKLPSVLWAYRTTTRTLTGETPFRLAYGSETVIPVEVGLISYRVENYDENKNDEVIRLQRDLVDEVWATAEKRLA